MKEYNPNSLNAGLKAFSKGHNESDLIDLFKALNIEYEQYYSNNYDYYNPIIIKILE